VSVDVLFGHVTMEIDEDFGELFPTLNWEPMPEENDGTSRKYSISPGLPWRSVNTLAFSQLLARRPALEDLYLLCKPDYAGFNNLEVTPLSDDVMAAIARLPEDGDPWVVDWCRFLKYWSRRSRQEFGDEARLGFF
jgi:hypothetical protein